MTTENKEARWAENKGYQAKSRIEIINKERRKKASKTYLPRNTAHSSKRGNERGGLNLRFEQKMALNVIQPIFP
jgi:hypothetical protein